MFNNIPKQIQDRMDFLKNLEITTKAENGPRPFRLHQITPEVGRFIAILAASAPRGRFIEFGTSGGYSALWLSLACREVSTKLTTYDMSIARAPIAKETFESADVNDVVEVIFGNILLHLDKLGDNDISFCFMDAGKEMYLDCYEAVIPKLVKGGFFVADNSIDHGSKLDKFFERVDSDERVDAVLVPIGSGELVCRKL